MSDCSKEGCPFAFTDESEYAQNMGCLPEPYDWIKEFKSTGRVISCHEDKEKKCVGFLKYAKEKGITVPPNAEIVTNIALL